MSFVVKNNLDRFLVKLKNYQQQGDLVGKVLKLLKEKMLEIARDEYAGISVDLNVDITDNKATLTANKEGLMYIEFGTGLVGEQSGYPKDKLPTETFTFESPKGTPQSTQGWVYYYDNPKTKIMGGWFFGNTFTRGQVAGMQMFNISKRMREYVQTDLADDIRKGE